MSTASPPQDDLFRRVLDSFKKDLSRQEKQNFSFTDIKGLNLAIDDLQKKQHSQRRLQNLSRLKPFLEAMEQYGKVVEVFCNSSEFVAFVWGPMKFLLQVSTQNSYLQPWLGPAMWFLRDTMAA